MRWEYKAIDNSTEKMTEEARDWRELVQVVVFPSNWRVWNYTSSYAIMKRRVKPKKIEEILGKTSK